MSAAPTRPVLRYHGGRRLWTRQEEALLRKLYPNTSSKEISRRLDRTLAAVYGRAEVLGLNKSEEYLASPEACRLRRGDNVGAAFRFKPGQTPANKGLRRPGWAPGRMRETQFKKGNHPQTWKPIGTTRFSKEGYLQRKVTDTGYSPRDWKGVHVLLWEETNGPVPRGHAIAFKDGNKTHIALDNLECISRRELMARNTVHRLPKELAQVIQLAGALKRQIRRRENGTKQNVGPARPPVRGTRKAQRRRQAHGS